MAFSKKTWKNRNSQYPTRRILTRVDTQVSTAYDVTRDEGTVTEAGDDFSAENMNALEQRIADGFDNADGRLNTLEGAVTNKANKVDLTNISITGSTNNTGATISSGTFFYKDGDLAQAKTSIANGATLTLNTNYEVVTDGGLNNLNASLSHVGMIIHSTTLDTEAKVKAIYGSNTSWIQHSGYVLRGATSGVTANNATKTGGNDNAIVVSHAHKGNGNLMTYTGGDTGGAGFVPSSQNFTYWRDNNNNVVRSTGESGTNKNIPNYKSVYIWERIA